MNQNFEHLEMPLVYSGRPKYSMYPLDNEVTARNKENRIQHGNYVKRQSGELSRFWNSKIEERRERDLPIIPGGIPIMLEIEPDTDVEFLRGLGFEIVSELIEGYVLVSSEDVELEKFNLKLQQFIENANNRCNSPAKVYGLKSNDERIDKIISKSLKEKWNNLNDITTYLVEISVSCNGSVIMPDKPKKNNGETDEHYANRLSNWEERYQTAYLHWDELVLERQNAIESFVSFYNGTINGYIENGDNYVRFPDSFTAKISINGKGLKDFVVNFPHLFEIVLLEDIAVAMASEQRIPIELENVNLIEPNQDAPIIGIIDSGIQSNNPLISPALLESYSYVPSDNDTEDKVANGGHGTRVAGVALINNLSLSGNVKLPFWLRNIRVLDDQNILKKELGGADLLRNIIQKYNINANNKTRIFNHSIGEVKECELLHMSSWASVIDKYNYENDILFIQSSGNIDDNDIIANINSGHNYPDYLGLDTSRICNPAQSLQALTVGSVSPCEYLNGDIQSLGKENEPSSFSRSGPGIWDSMKPDVVECGGTHAVKVMNGNVELSRPEELCINAPRKILGNKLIARDIIGTSFSTPKVTSIAGALESLFPNASTLLYRGLIAQSAKWPEWAYRNENKSEVLRKIGYGIPSLERATTNNQYRVTLFSDKMSIRANDAHIYKIPIPEVIRSVGENYDILIEITLSYSASPRRTRRRVRGYLSTWVEWCSSRLGEDYDIFKNRVFETGRRDELDEGSLRWMIGDQRNYGQADNFSKKFSTLQKDWAFINSHQLPEDFCVAVRGHKGWGEAFPANYALIVSFEAINRDLEIYNEIRAAIEVEIDNIRAQIEINS